MKIDTCKLNYWLCNCKHVKQDIAISLVCVRFILLMTVFCLLFNLCLFLSHIQNNEGHIKYHKLLQGKVLLN